MGKIALFLCDCANEIKRRIDTSYLIDVFRERVDFSSHHRHLCDSHSLKRMRQLLLENNIERIVIGACTPQLHLETFQRVAQEVGISPFFVELVPLREQCAYVHKEKENATKKAKLLLECALYRVSSYKDIDEKVTDIQRSCLVIGGGVGGVNAALELAKKQIHTYIVEERPWIGGVTAQVGMAFPTGDCAYCVGVKSDIRGVRKCFYRAGLPFYPHLSIITNANVKKVEGAVGDFTVWVHERPSFVNQDCICCGECEKVCPVEVDDEFNKRLVKRKAIYKEFEAVPNRYAIDAEHCIFCKECERVCPEEAVDFSQIEKVHVLKVGAIIVATGIKEFDASLIPQYGYGVYKGVLTQLELARLLAPDGPTAGLLSLNGKEPKNIVMIQCVGSRDERFNSYCSRLCCMMAIKHAIMIKERNPKSSISICYIDVRTTGVEGYEDWYERARSMGVRFIPGRASEVEEKDGALIVHTEDISIGEKVSLPADLVVLSCGIEVSEGTKRIASLLGLSLNKDGFIEVIDPKVRFVETKRWGIFTCGGARGPTDIPETILQANAAASKVATLLLQGKIIDRRRYPEVDVNRCDGCRVCENTCQFYAIKIEDGKARTNRDVCRGCGACTAVCPLFAINLLGFDEGYIKTLELISKEGGILGFVCEECGGAAMDLAAFERREYDERLYLLSVPCLGKVSALDILKAINLGARGVVLIGCMKGRCHYGNDENIKKQYELAKEALSAVGKGERLLRIFSCGAETVSLMHQLSSFCKAL